MKNYKKVALNAVKTSGKMLRKEYERFDRSTIKLKSHHEILTKFDLLSEELIINEIRKIFPSDGFVSEERGEIKGYSGYIWYIDPIDGTTNFSMHNPLWSISLALAFEDELILGVIYVPVLDELYVAEKGEGATLNNKKIHVSDVMSGKILNTFCHGSKLSDIKKALVYYKKQKLDQLDCRQLGSAAIELAYIACGRVESFVAPGANSWDVAAGTLIVREAGGRVTDFSGRNWQIGSRDIIASNNKVHNEVMKVISNK